MTKEELKQEAEEYTNKLLEDWELYDPEALQEAYIASAEPREKRIAELEKEKAELKGEADSVLDNWCKGDDPCPHLKKRDDQLTKAKAIIKKLRVRQDDYCIDCTCYKFLENMRAEAEQFLSEVEK